MSADTRLAVGQSESAPVTFSSCTAAFASRIWRSHCVGLLLLPFGYLAFIAALTAMAAADPRIINGARGLAQTAVQFGVHPGRVAVAVGLAFFLVPVLAALQLSRMAANAVRAVIGQDRSLGSLELLCASPVSRRTLLGGILTAPILLVALDWLILTALLSVAGIISQLTLHINLSGKLGSAAWLIVAPLPLGVLGGALVLVLAVIKPGLTDQTAGPGSNVLRLASAAPALVVIVLIITFGQEWGESAIVAGATIVAVVGYVAVISMLWRVFRPEKILAP